MQLKATLKVINLFLALAAFIAVGIIALFNGEELIWIVGKAVGCFAACWIVLGYLATFVCLAVEGPQMQEIATNANGKKNGKKEE